MKVLSGKKFLSKYKILFRGQLHPVHEIKTTDRGSIVSFTIFHKYLWYSYNTFLNNLKDEFYQLTVPNEKGILVDENENEVKHFRVASV